ncbi:hypothetical protein [Wolbachia endosymbiont (group B) of Eucosma cana]|uniref:hypothetical protein n=1 Tax=Wolbachia endosymbiont (group B) of Eucosma cana TaxID=2954012 RepID=UPI002226B942|nr:hypothetical protein [Wolbachia endosymbiont (group B) of Eucosma cana]
MIGRIFNIFSSEEKNSPPEKNNNSFSNSTESLLVQSTKKNPQFDDQSRADASPQINLL